MIDDTTIGIFAARSWTRINAFTIDTGAIQWTIAIHAAFGTAFIVRITAIFGQTFAGASTISFGTNSIDAARCWLAWCRRWQIS